jgi:hypothetical protein
MSASSNARAFEDSVSAWQWSNAQRREQGASRTGTVSDSGRRRLPPALTVTIRSLGNRCGSGPDRPASKPGQANKKRVISSANRGASTAFADGEALADKTVR